MKFIKEILLSLLKSIVFFGVSLLLGLSLMQRKFPPSLAEADKTLKNYQSILQSFGTMSAQSLGGQIVKTEHMISSRETLMAELAKIDPEMLEQLKRHDEEVAKLQAKEKMKDVSALNKDWNIYKTRMDQSEYKIKLLEHEVSTLKEEIKKMKLGPEKITR